MKILIVDDNPDSRQLISDVFAEQGWEVIGASDGREALSALEGRVPDVILSDILMPRMDGFEFLREVRRSGAADVVFIFYTAAFEKNADEEFALSLGADAYIAEPLGPDQVFSVVRAIAGEKKPRRGIKGREFSEEEFLREHNVILSQALLDKFTRLRAEEERRRKAEEELRRVKEQIEQGQEPRLHPHDRFPACPFRVSDEIHAPLERMEETCRLLERELRIAAPRRLGTVLGDFVPLAQELRSYIDGLLQYVPISKDRALNPVQRMDVLLQTARTDIFERFPQLAAHLDRMQEQLSDYRGRTEQLLQLSEIWNAELKKEEVDLTTIARSIADELRRSEPEREVECLIQRNVRASADRGLIELALTHLLGNAWKFTSRRGSAKVEFATTTIGGKKVFFVRDNGIGFDMGCSDTLFTAFSKLHPSQEFPGSGIGLALVKTVISRHGGTVWAVGEVDAGATFYFSLERM